MVFDQAVVDLRAAKDTLCAMFSSESKIGNERRLRVFNDPRRFRQFARVWAWRTLMGAVVVFMFMWAASAWNAVEEPVRHAWLPCVDGHDMHYGDRLEALTRASADAHGTWCTTLDTALSLPCLCCVRGSGDGSGSGSGSGGGSRGGGGSRCWSDARIAKNYTKRMADAYDRLSADGPWLKRRLPSSMRVCYTMGHGDHECVDEEGPVVPRILRAIEQLHGWAPAGTEMVDYIAPA